MASLRAIRLLLTPALAVALLSMPATASAAVDATTTTVTCSPASVSTGHATTCTATVTDTETSPLGTPGGSVQFTASPATGMFSASGTCALPAASGASASCHLTFTPASGGDYTIKAAYSGDASHTASTDTFSLTAVDTTTTTLSCFASSVSIDSSTSCTATITDASSSKAPLGTVSFTSAPTTGAFSAIGICHWHPSGNGGSATCDATFTPSAAGRYTLTASYSGDGHHAASSGSFSLAATTTPAGGGPGSHGGSGTLPIGISGGPPPAGTLNVARRARVSHARSARLKLSCAGRPGSHCTGTLTLTTTVKAKVKVKVKVKVRSKGKGRHHTAKTKTKTKTKTTTKTILVGSVGYSLATGASQTFTVKLSRGARKALAKARRGRLKVKALTGGSFPKTVTLVSHKHKKHKRHKGHKHHKHRRKK